jgi:hypothetical protein
VKQILVFSDLKESILSNLLLYSENKNILIKFTFHDAFNCINYNYVINMQSSKISWDHFKSIQNTLTFFENTLELVFLNGFVHAETWVQ